MTYLRTPACFLIATFLLSAGVPASSAAEPPADWKAGVARATITPDEPMWLSGFADRTAPAEGKLQDLFAKAIALEDSQGSRFVLVTADLISIPSQLRRAMEKHLQARHRLPPASLMLNASHTHCGPELAYVDDPLNAGDPARAAQGRKYLASLESKMAGAIDGAIENLAPARLTYSRARCGFAMNRRLKSDLTTGDPYLNRPNPEGVVDHEVPVLRVDGLDASPRAIVFGYACHNTTMKGQLYSGDYAGYAQEFVEAAHPGAVALFVAGCGGDQNGYPRFRGGEWSANHGRALATAVEAAMQTAPRPVRGPLRASLDVATLDYAAPPTRRQLQEKLERLAGDPNAPFTLYETNHCRRLLLQYDREGDILRHYRCPIQTLRLGDDLLLVALPGEPVVDYSLRLKKELAGSAAVWVAGFSNDVFAYLPSRRVLREGGYEASRAMTYFINPLQPGPFAENVEERIVEKVQELARAGRRVEAKPVALRQPVVAKAAAPRRFHFPDPTTGGCRVATASTELPMIHTAQILPLDDDGRPVGDGKASEQVKRTFANLARTLAAAKSDLSQVVKLNVYVSDASVSVEVKRWLAENYPGDERPAVSYVTTRLARPETLLAIDAVAHGGGGGGGGDGAGRVTFGPAARWAPSSTHAFGVLPAGPRVYISGQAEKGNGSLADATTKTLEGLEKSLQFCGLDRRRVVQLKAFCLPMSDAATVERAVAEFFGDQPAPPLVLVEWKSSLPIEIELIASADPKPSAPGTQASAATSTIEFLTPPGMPKSPIFSRIARVDGPRVAYVAGLFAGGPGRDAAQEVRGLFPLLRETLQGVDSDLERMAKATYYVADAEVSGLLNKTRPDYYHPDRPPAASKAEVAGAGLLGHRITIDMIAVPR